MPFDATLPTPAFRVWCSIECDVMRTNVLNTPTHGQTMMEKRHGDIWQLRPNDENVFAWDVVGDELRRRCRWIIAVAVHRMWMSFIGSATILFRLQTIKSNSMTSSRHKNQFRIENSSFNPNRVRDHYDESECKQKSVFSSEQSKSVSSSKQTERSMNLVASPFPFAAFAVNPQQTHLSTENIFYSADFHWANFPQKTIFRLFFYFRKKKNENFQKSDAKFRVCLCWHCWKILFKFCLIKFLK